VWVGVGLEVVTMVPDQTILVLTGLKNSARKIKGG
jgi:hypothetical protein